MTVTRPYEYGKTEVGNRHSSFVSAKHLLTTVTRYSISARRRLMSLNIPLPRNQFQRSCRSDEGQQALGRLAYKEINNKETKEVLFEAMVTSAISRTKRRMARIIVMIFRISHTKCRCLYNCACYARRHRPHKYYGRYLLISSTRMVRSVEYCANLLHIALTNAGAVCIPIYF